MNAVPNCLQRLPGECKATWYLQTITEQFSISVLCKSHSNRIQSRGSGQEDSARRIMKNWNTWLTGMYLPVLTLLWESVFDEHFYLGQI